MLATSCNVESLLKEISANGATLSNEDDASRQQCLAAARSLCYALETPLEAILSIMQKSLPPSLSFVHLLIIGVNLANTPGCNSNWY